jgi:hypothetical protein
MTMVVAVPAMPVVVIVANSDNNLCARRCSQRGEE